MIRVGFVCLFAFLVWALVMSRLRGCGRWFASEEEVRRRACVWLERARQQWCLEFPEKARGMERVRRHCDWWPMVVMGVSGFGVIAGRLSLLVALFLSVGGVVCAIWVRLRVLREELGWLREEKVWSEKMEFFSSERACREHWRAVEARLWMELLPSFLRVPIEGKWE